jgi:hypothetical protein
LLLFAEEREQSIFQFAIQDWIKGLTDAHNPTMIWADIKRRTNLPELLDSIQQLPYTAGNGKVYQMDFITDKGLYLIAQHLCATKAHPALQAIKKFLADAGVFLDETRREYNKLMDEGFTWQEAEEWLDVRDKQKRQRGIITAIWRERGINRPTDYADLTNQVRCVALGLTATRHKRQLAVKDTPRNHISAADNATIQITEFTSALLHIHRDSLGKPELSEDIEDVRPIMDAARPEIQNVFSKKPRRLRAGNSSKLLE